jgi:peptidoglycan/LPS O-acetylase OafA/YrhL
MNKISPTQFSEKNILINSIPIANEKLKRYDALTGLRALAVTLVFIYHNLKYWKADLHPVIIRILNEFHTGVSIFFVLSGFLIAYTYGDRTIINLKSYTQYIIIRLARIIPLYWLILTAYYLDPNFGNQKFSALTYTLAHGFSNKFNLIAIAQSWSLSVEMSFYFLAPILFITCKKQISNYFFALITLFIGFVTIGYLWYFINGNPNQFFYPFSFILNSTIAGRATEFIAGILLANYIRQNNFNFLIHFRHKTMIGFAGFLFTIILLGWFQNENFYHGYENPIGKIIFMTILPFFISYGIAGLIFEKTLLQRFLSSKFLILLGNASYSFYLIHISYVNIKIRGVWIGPDRNFIILWTLSIFLYFYFEKPIYQWIRTKVKDQ